MAEYWALTFWQPWATLAIEGWKPFEFRGWKTPDFLIGEKMGIHAGARPVRLAEVRAILYSLERGGDAASRTGLIEHGKVTKFLEQLLAAPKSLPMSAMLGLATIGPPLRNTELMARLGLEGPIDPGLPAINDSDRVKHTNWAWPLQEIQRFQPMIPVSGHQGLWVWKQPTALL